MALSLMFRWSNRALQVGFSSSLQTIARRLSSRSTPKYLSISVSLASPRLFMKAPPSLSRFASTQARPSIQLLNVSQSRDSLVINWSNGGQGKSYQNKFDNFWLRDNCQCSQCYSSNQRLFDTASLPTDIQPNQVTVSGNTALEIQWQDGHESNYAADWLLENAYDCSNDFLTKIQESDPVKDPVVWGKEIGEDPPRVGYNGVMKDDRTFLEMSDKIDVYGFCLVEDTPLEVAPTVDLAKRIGVIRDSFYGGICIVEPELGSM